MDIYCSTCGEPFELYIETDEDRQEIQRVREGRCSLCKGVKPPTCHDCGNQMQGRTLSENRGCGSNDACDDKLICNSCWGYHEEGCHINHTRKYESNKLSKAQASAVLYDILGEDLDGVASMMDDGEYAGLIE